MGGDKIKISVVVKEDKWKEFKKKCIDRGIQYSEQIERLIEDFVRK